MIKSVVWASTIDYPDELSAVIFIGECNWGCGFCHNLTLIDNPTLDFDEDILPRLLERQDFINHIVISGGECTLSPDLEYMLKKLKSEGFVIGIHSNGSNPNILKNILPLVSFVGMDIKTRFNEKYNKITQSNIMFSDLKESMDLIIDSEIEYEFRTTVFPTYVDKEDCLWISEKLNSIGADKYVIQQFEDKHVETDVKPYDKEYLEEIVTECNSNIPTTLRGY